MKQYKYLKVLGLQFKTPPFKRRQCVTSCDIVGCTTKTLPIRRYCGYHRWRIAYGPNKKKGKGTVTKFGHRRFEHKGKAKFEHVLVWESFNGPIPPGYVIHHKDLNPGNNHISNLKCLTKNEHTSLHMKLYWHRRRLPFAE